MSPCLGNEAQLSTSDMLGNAGLSPPCQNVRRRPTAGRLGAVPPPEEQADMPVSWGSWHGKPTLQDPSA